MKRFVRPVAFAAAVLFALPAVAGGFGKAVGVGLGAGAGFAVGNAAASALFRPYDHRPPVAYGYAAPPIYTVQPAPQPYRIVSAPVTVINPPPIIAYVAAPPPEPMMQMADARRPSGSASSSSDAEIAARAYRTLGPAPDGQQLAGFQRTKEVGFNCPGGAQAKPVKQITAKEGTYARWECPKPAR